MKPMPWMCSRLISVNDTDRRSPGDAGPDSVRETPAALVNPDRRDTVDCEFVTAKWVDALFRVQGYGPRDRIIDRRDDLHASVANVGSPL